MVALQLHHCLVARSHECDWQEVKNIPVITEDKLGPMSTSDLDMAMTASTSALAQAAVWGPPQPHLLLEQGLAVYKTNLEKLTELKPNVILTQLQDVGGAVQLEVYMEAARQLLGYSPKLVHLAAQDLRSVWRDMQSIADALGVGQKGRQLVEDLQRRLQVASDMCRGRRSWRVACVQWPDPWYAAGSWVPELIHMAKARDVLGRVEEAVNFTSKQLQDAKPEVLLFAICGFDLKQSAEKAREALASLRRECPGLKQQPKVVVVDGVKVFSRPGPWLVQSMEALVEALHEEAQQFGHRGNLWQVLPA